LRDKVACKALHPSPWREWSFKQRMLPAEGSSSEETVAQMNQ